VERLFSRSAAAMTVGVLFRRAPIETVLPFEIAGQFGSGADLNIVIFFEGVGSRSRTCL
jgi:hypothetical protein